MDGSIIADVISTAGCESYFPERQTPLIDRTRDCGVCFSGGGTRSLAASMGQLRGLYKLGLLSGTRYISSVSGGSWAATNYVYYKSGAANDTQLLGKGPSSAERSTWTLEEWGKSLSSSNLAAPATKSFLSDFLKQPKKNNLSWINTVRDTFFSPFGLDQPNYFSLDHNSVSAILEANRDTQPEWSHDQFDICKDARPYLIVNATMLWPIERELFHHTHPHRIPIQFTPLYVGNAHHLELNTNKAQSNTNFGGGFISPYALGSSGPNSLPGPNRMMPKPESPFSLWHASGISSAAFAYPVADSVLVDTPIARFMPKINYWAVADAEHSEDHSMEQTLADGGALDNTGLMALLQRQVKSIVVFINSEVPISKSNNKVIIDRDIAPLFGVDNTELPNNTVFEASAYDDLLENLWETNKVNGGLCLHRQSYTTLENNWFGTPSYAVDILWVYNSPVEKWIQSLSKDMQKTVRYGVKGFGELSHFPNYKTIGEEFLHMVELTSAQVSCIADMHAWSIEQNSTIFNAMLSQQN